MSCFGQTIRQNLRTDRVHSYFSCRGNDTRLKPTSRQDISQKSNPSEPSTYVEGGEAKQGEAQQRPMEIQVLDDPMTHNNRLNVNAASYSIYPQPSHVLLTFANGSPTSL